MLIVGLMSGTSLDGMDAALVDVRRSSPERYRVRLLGFVTVPYGAALRRDLASACHGNRVSLSELARLDAAIAAAGARALEQVCRRAQVARRAVRLVGSHGQTVFHGPAGDGSRLSLQIGSPARLAALLGTPVVGDFRTADLCAGGEGAPLMPIAHRMLYAHRSRRRVVQNLGGIGNATWIDAGGARVAAFDTGPGVMLIDELVRAASRGRRPFDVGGRLARRGRIDEDLVRECLRHPYFRRRPPKSTGRELFGAPFARALEHRGRRRGLSPEDLVATATAFTAAAVADQLGRFVRLAPATDEVLLAGGGARNPTLVAMIRERLAPLAVRPIEAVGGHGDALEAIGFAILARAAIDGVRFDLRAITGATAPVALGVLAPAGAASQFRRVRRD